VREYRHWASTWVLLADVRMSERRRQGLSARKVELYRQWLENGRHAPPVRLARDGSGGFVVRAAVTAWPRLSPRVTSASRRSCAASWG
jgi:hypothetical protein